MVNHNTLICNLRRNNKLIPSRGMTIPFFKNLTHSYLKTRLEQSSNRGSISKIYKLQQNEVVNSDVVPSRIFIVMKIYIQEWTWS
jgi:hypothetical protein